MRLKIAREMLMIIMGAKMRVSWGRKRAVRPRRLARMRLEPGPAAAMRSWSLLGFLRL